MIGRFRAARTAARHGEAARNWPAIRVSLTALLLLVARIGMAAAADAPPFRLCADPDNLPFSSTSARTPGFYIELGQKIAARLGRPFEPVWTRTYFTKRAVRTTLLAGHCDGFIGVPDSAEFMGPRLIFSKPVAQLGYALVLPKDLSVHVLSDLAGRRVAVQFASTPQNLLATRNDVQPDTVLSPEEGMKDLAKGQADVGFLWGPSAGWINKTAMHDNYKVVPVAGPQMQWSAAIAFPRGQAALRDQVDRALELLDGTIGSLKAKYGFPAAAPVRLAAVQPAPATTSPERKAAAIVAQPAPKPADHAAQVAAGHELFNQNCSHCHGPDAVQGERRINLRLLHHRYGNKIDQVFFYTVTHGRMTKGMPNWSGILTAAQFHKILAFLHSVQEP